jgi:hypothetical protein
LGQSRVDTHRSHAEGQKEASMAKKRPISSVSYPP